MSVIERAGNEIAAVLMECCTVEECENTLAEIHPDDWKRAAQKVLDVANHRGAVEERDALREAAQHAVDVAYEFSSVRRLPEWAERLRNALGGQ